MILQGDALHLPLRSGSVDCAICSPPYWGMRRYSAQKYLGLEKSPLTYVYKLARVFRELRRVLRDDGVLWLNLAGCYSSGDRATCRSGASHNKGYEVQNEMPRPAMPSGYKPGDYIDLPGMVMRALQADGWCWRATMIVAKKNPMPESVQSVRWERHRRKIGGGWQPGTHPGSDGSGDERGRVGGGRTWYGTHGGTVPPETAVDWRDCPGCATCSPNVGMVLRRGSWRPTTSHEFVFMLTKSHRYWADGEAVREASIGKSSHDLTGPGYDADGQSCQTGSRLSKKPDGWATHKGGHGSFHREGREAGVASEIRAGRNLRSILSLASQPYAWAMCKACQEIYSPERFRRLHRDNGRRVCGCGAKEWLSHYATFSEALVEPLIKASTSEKGCCPTCGAGWARVVERKPNPSKAASIGEDLSDGAFIGRTANPQTSASLHRNPGGVYAESKTLSWRPTCACPPSPPVPAVVLDPFSGAGTVCFVAAKLGRKGIGVDLSWEYSRMAEARISKGESWDPPAVPEAQMVLGV